MIGDITGNTFSVNTPAATVTDQTIGGTVIIIDVANNSYHFKGNSDITWSDTNGGRFVNETDGAVDITVTNGSSITVEPAVGGSQPVNVIVASGSTVEVSGAIGTITADNTSTVDLQAGTTVESVDGGATITGQGEIESVTVSTETALLAALSNVSVKKIVLADNITTTSPVAPKAGVTIEGADFTLTLNAVSDSSNKTAEGIYIAPTSTRVTIQNLKVTTSASNTDNLIEIYGTDTSLINVEVTNGKKAGIYVNNDGQGELIANFKDIKTSGNAWDAGIGLVAQQEGSAVIANFAGNNVFSETAGVYSDNVEGSNYLGSVTVTGLGDAVVVDGKNKWNVKTLQ